MAVINSNDLKPGVVFRDSGETLVVLKYQHIKKGRGQATIRVKVKNIETSSIFEKTYTNEQKLELADVEKRSSQFLYSDGTAVHFMDTGDYSQFQFPAVELDTELQFLIEGGRVVTLFLDGKPISVELPKTVELEVTTTTSAVAGNTATNATKDATLETGASIQVPLFIKQGEKIKVNTESGTYISRVN